MMNTNSFGLAMTCGVALMALAGASARAQVDIAADNAENYTTWGQGQQLQGGTGFGPWVHYFLVPPSGGFAGQFLATANNPDLNNVGPTAWGMFSNNGGAGGSGVQMAASLREFTTGPLSLGQRFAISFEHGNVLAGNMNPNGGERTGGWVGFTLRNGTNAQQIEDPIRPFGEINATFGLGFQGGGGEYMIYDTISPSGRLTGVPFTTNGLRVTVTIDRDETSPTNAEVVITPLGSGASQPVTLRARIDGVVNAFGIYSRNVELADAFFNSATITQLGGSICDVLDFNNDGIENDPTDIEAFLSVYSGGPCIPTGNTCNDIDFNNDGIENDPTDIEAFLSVYSGGPCL